MTQIKKKYLTISKGQISDKLIERTDIDLLDKSGQEVTNFQSSIYGSLHSTIGSTVMNYIDDTHDTYGLRADAWLRIFPITIPEFPEDNTFFLIVNLRKGYLYIMSSRKDRPSTASCACSYVSFSPHRISVIQDKSLILMATGAGPILKINYTIGAGGVTSLSYEVFSIPADKIMKGGRIQSESETSSAFFDINYNSYTTQRIKNTADVCKVVQSSGTSNTGSEANVGFAYFRFSKGNFTKTQLDKLLTGQKIYAINDSAVLQILEITNSSMPEGANYYQISGAKVKFLIGASNIDINTQRMNKFSGWTFEYKPTIFAGNDINTEDYPLSIENYPLTIAFYQQRLIIGGTTMNGGQIIASAIGKYNDFSGDETDSTSAFAISIASNKDEEIVHLVINQGIQLFCKDSEWTLDSGILTRTSDFIKNSEIGSNTQNPEQSRPIIAPNGTTLFLNKSSNSINEFSYNVQQNSYYTPYLNLLTDVLDNEVITNFNIIQKGKETLIYACLRSGDLIIVNYLSEHQIQSFTRVHFRYTRFVGAYSVEQTRITDNSSIVTENKVILFAIRYNDYGLYQLICDENDEAFGCSKNVAQESTGYFICPKNSCAISLEDEVNVYDVNGKFIGSNTPISTGDYWRVWIPNTSEGIEPGKMGINIPSKFVSNPLNYGQTTFDKDKNIAQLKLVLSDKSNPEFLRVNGKKGRVKDNYVTFYRVARPSRKCQFTIENDVYPCEILSIEVDLEI